MTPVKEQQEFHNTNKVEKDCVTLIKLFLFECIKIKFYVAAGILVNSPRACADSMNLHIGHGKHCIRTTLCLNLISSYLACVRIAQLGQSNSSTSNIYSV